MRRKWIASVLAAACLCSGCALLPQEEQLPEAPVLREFTAEVNTLVAVERGDIVKEMTIDCSYEPARKELMSFPVGGERIAEIYVVPGSQVTEGQLLAELDNTQINKQIAQQQQLVEDLQRQADQAKEKLSMHYERLSRLNDAVGADPGRFGTQQSSANRTCLELIDECDYLEKLLVVEQQELENLEFELSQRQIHATFDGTVLTVPQSSDNSSVFFAGQTVCLVADMTTGAFEASFSAGLLAEGDSVMIACDDGEHEAVVTELTDGKSGKKNASFQLLTPDPALTISTKGKITLVTDRRDDVLYLPTSAVESSENVSYVNYLGENGLKSTKVVETGLTAGGLVEIVSGLEEGEMVIG